MQKTRSRTADELARLQWDLSTEDAIAQAGITYANAARDIEGKRQRRAARSDGDGNRVSEESAALDRFNRNSADLQARQQATQKQDAAHQRKTGGEETRPPAERQEATLEQTAEQKRKEILRRHDSTPEQRAESREQGQSQSRGRSR
jgi:hypothetical protein